MGGGAIYSTLNNSLIIANTASDSGGGVSCSVMANCTVVSNTASYGGGVLLNDGWESSSIESCIIYFNSATLAGNNWQTNVAGPSYQCGYSCTTPDLGGEGNITQQPCFADAAIGNYSLQPWSRCIDAGLTLNWWIFPSLDLAGSNRFVNGVVDMGAYEASGGRFDIFLNHIEEDWACFTVTNFPVTGQIEFQWLENGGVRQDWTSLFSTNFTLCNVTLNSTNQLMIGVLQGTNHLAIMDVNWVQAANVNAALLFAAFPRMIWSGEIGSAIQSQTISVTRRAEWDRVYLSAAIGSGQGWPEACGIRVNVNGTFYDLPSADSVEITESVPADGSSVPISLTYSGSSSVYLDQPVYLLQWNPEATLTWAGGDADIYIGHSSTGYNPPETFDVRLTSLPPNSGDFTNVVMTGSSGFFGSDWPEWGYYNYWNHYNFIPVPLTRTDSSQTVLLGQRPDNGA